MRVSAVLAVVTLSAAAPPGRADTFTVTVVAVDAAGKPVAGADAALFWQDKAGAMTPMPANPTGADGRATVRVADWNERRPVVVLAADRQTGGLVGATRADDGKELRVTLTPTVRVTGRITSPDLGGPPPWAVVYVAADGFRAGMRFAQSTTKDGTFALTLPAGGYRMLQYGQDIETKRNVPLDLKPGTPAVNLGTLAFAATPVAKLRGKPVPDFTAAAARGTKPEFRAADYKGKWVYVEFWGHW